MAERTGDRNSPLANMVLRWMAYNQPGLTDKQMDACLAGADALEEVERLREQLTTARVNQEHAESMAEAYREEMRLAYWKCFQGDTGTAKAMLYEALGGEVDDPALDLAAPATPEVSDG